MLSTNKKFGRIISRHPKTSIATGLLASAVVVIAFVAGHDNSSMPPDTFSNPDNTAEAKVSHEKTPQTSAANRSGSSALAQGGATDSHGNGVSGSGPATSSASGLITLITPSANTTLKPGDTIGGTAKVTAVEYRLVDDQVGVLAQGELSVVNGRFSGIISFKPHSASGELKIFSFDQDYKEVNSLSIKLKLSSG